MSVGMLDGAEHQWPNPPFFDISSDIPIYSATGRYGGMVYQPGNSNVNRWRVIAASQDVENWFGLMYFQSGGTLGGTAPIMVLFGDGVVTTHLSLYLNSDGSLSLYRGTSAGTLLETSATGLVALGAWFSLELYGLIDDTTGAYEVRVDGVNVMDGTGVDTRNGGTDPKITVIGTTKINNGSTCRVDDVYLTTGDGVDLSGFQGEISIERIAPNGAGNYTELTPTGSATNWQNVDEVPIVATDYNGSATVGNQDTYTYSNLTATTGTVIGTVLHQGIFKFFPGFIRGRRVIRIGGVDYNGADSPVLSASLRPFSELIEESPATSTPWTISEVNGLEAGFEVRPA